MRLQCVVMCIFAVYTIDLTETKHSRVSLPDEDMLLFWKQTNAKRCKPFTAFKIDCNQCVCAADGVSSCTRMDCGTRDDEIRRKNEFVKPPIQEYETEETDESV